MNSSLIKAAAAITVIMCLTYSAAGILVRPSVMVDPSFGLSVLQSRQVGAPWNNLIEPDYEDIAKDHTYFYAVWSPAQYEIPGLIMKAGVSLGTALSTLMILGSLASLAGWWFLFQALSFDRGVATMSVALIAATRGYNFSFLSYNGGELLSLITFPWLALAVHRARHTAVLPLVAALAMLAGFYAKNTMVMYLLAWIGAVQLTVVWERGITRDSIRQMVLTGVAVGAAIGILYFAYVARGWTALQQKEFSPQEYSNVVPWAMPILTGIGWDELLSWLFYHPSRPVMFDYKKSMLLLGPVAVATMAWLWWLTTSSDRRWIARQIAICCAMGVVMFAYLFVSNSSGSLELGRHYRIYGYLLLPLIVADWAASRRTALKIAVALVLLAPCAYGVTSFASNWRRHHEQRDAHSARVQVTHLQLTPRTVQFLATLNEQLPSGSLVVTPTPMHGLEFQRTRVLRTAVVDESVEKIRATPKSGRVDNLVVIAEMQAMTDERIAIWLESFRGYAGATWDSFELDHQRFYVPAGQAVNRAWLEAHVH